MDEAVTAPMSQIVLEVLAMVAPGQEERTVDTRLDEAGIDSLCMVEAIVHLEAELGVDLGDDFVDEVTEDVASDPEMTIGKFSEVLARHLPTIGDGDPTAV
jgi:acyl carrier protein